MGFAKTRGGYADEFGIVLQVGDRLAAGVAHAGAEAADQLRDHFGDGAFVGDAALDALGDVFGVGCDAFLGVAVGRAFVHRTDRAHASIGLEVAALEQDDLAGRLFGPG